MQVIVFEVPHVLILASTSIYRRELLGRLNISFDWQAPEIDETAIPAENGMALVNRLARLKAAAVARQRPNDWVIGSDQAAVLTLNEGEAILGKPANREACIAQLLRCSGHTLSFVTAVAVNRHCDAALHEFFDTTRVVFRELDRASIERYADQEPALDCAGGFKSEGLGISLCERIETTDPTALIGLPLIRLAALLRRIGFVIP